MVTNFKNEDSSRHGAAIRSMQTQTGSGKWIVRRAATGIFMDVKQDDKPFTKEIKR